VTAAISVPLFAETERAVEAGLASLAGQSLTRAALEIVIIDRTPGHRAAAAAEPFAGRFSLRILPQGPASLAASGNLAVFGASAPLLLFLDPAARPDPGLAAAHVAAQARIGAGAAAVLGIVDAGEGTRLDRLVAAFWPRLLAFGWKMPPAGQGACAGGSVSVRRDTLIARGLFDSQARPGFADVDWPWRLVERRLGVEMSAQARMSLAGTETIEGWIGRAFRLGLQETQHRPAGRRSLADRLGPPSHWGSRRRTRGADAERIDRMAFEAAEGLLSGSAAGRKNDERAVRDALYAAWRAGRSEAIRRSAAIRA